jgi:hypothetical protein
MVETVKNSENQQEVCFARKFTNQTILVRETPNTAFSQTLIRVRVGRLRAKDYTGYAAGN